MCQPHTQRKEAYIKEKRAGCSQLEGARWRLVLPLSTGLEARLTYEPVMIEYGVPGMSAGSQPRGRTDCSPTSIKILFKERK